MFSRDDAQWLSALVRAIYAAPSPARLAANVIGLSHRRFRGVLTGCEEVSLNGSFYGVHGAVCETALPSDYAACIHDNPNFQLLCSGHAPAVMQHTRLFSRQAFKNTDYYNGLARPVGFDDQMQCVARGASSYFSFGFFRDLAFTDREFTLLRLVQPHLQAAWHRLHTSFDISGSMRIELTARFRPRGLTAIQREVLGVYFQTWSDKSSLPSPLRDWLKYSFAALNRPAPDRPLRAFVASSARGRLFARLFPALDGALHLNLMEYSSEPNFFRLRRQGLTLRECEVLHWLAAGKRDSEIATIAGCSPATISKHVENILAKLGADNRATAVCEARTRLATGT